MKKTLFILLAATGLRAGTAQAQNVVLGEKVPELKVAEWLDGRQAAPAPLTYIEFFHSANPACRTSLERLSALSRRPEARLRVLVVTQEDTARLAPLLRPLLSPHVAAALHAEKSFGAFGVDYVPFGVLVDARNRALWLGNSLLFDLRPFESSTR